MLALLFPYSCLSSYLNYSSVSLSYFILVVPMCECLGKHSGMSPQFPTAILNGTFFAMRNILCFGRNIAYRNLIILLLLVLCSRAQPVNGGAAFAVELDMLFAVVIRLSEHVWVDVAHTCSPAVNGTILDFNISLFLFCLKSFILVWAVQI